MSIRSIESQAQTKVHATSPIHFPKHDVQRSD